MLLPDRALSDKGGLLALVVEIQAWLTLCFKRAASFSVGENTMFQGVHKHKH